MKKIRRSYKNKSDTARFTFDFSIVNYIKLIFTVFCIMISLAINAQPGVLDTTFNSTDFGGGGGANNIVYASVQQSDGKIIIGGDFTSYNGIARNRIARINSNGSLDLTFDPGTGASGGPIRTISIQSDGKIIIGGNFNVYNGSTRNKIARINPDGSLDYSFNSGSGASNVIYETTIQNDGKIIIVGAFTSYNYNSIKGVARLNINGSIDLTFNIGLGPNNTVATASVQNDGKIVIAGNFTSVNGIGRNRIARINSNGSLDTSFDPGLGANYSVWTSFIQSDGKILIGGDFTSFNSTTKNYLTRLNNDGSQDSLFNPGNGLNSTVYSCKVQNDGKIIIGGNFTSYNGTTTGHILRLNLDGSLDMSFILNAGSDCAINSVFCQSDGLIIVGGDFIYYNGIPKNYITRLNNDGSLDSYFNPFTGVNGYLPSINTISIQNDEKIIIGGKFTSYNGVARNSIARLYSNGQLDTTFCGSIGNNGTVTTSCIQNNGKLLIGGFFSNCNGIPIENIARLNINGTLDTTFNPGNVTHGSVDAIAIQDDGKIIVGGRFYTPSGSWLNNIYRLTPDGLKDTTFSCTGNNSNISSIVIQADGKIVIGGDFTSINGTSINRIARLNFNGTLDTTFNPGSGSVSSISCIGLQNDGKIIVGGLFNTFNGVAINCLCRLSESGHLDTTFYIGSGAQYGVSTISIQSDNKIIIGGNFISYNGTTRNHIARLNTNGSLDNSFNPGIGINTPAHVYATSIQSDGKIIIGGDFTSYNGISRNRIVRVLGVCEQINSEIYQTACNSYSINNQTYTVSGIYTQTLVSNSGCDSILVLNLNICNSSNSTFYITDCDSFTLNGITYNSSGTYSQTLINTDGCDSIITLHLTLNNSNSVVLEETACGSYTLNGQTYFNSGTFIQNLVGFSGCDSIIYLNLTINNASSSDIIKTVCDSYTLNGQTYINSGIYTQTLINTENCDSLVTIYLTIDTVNHATTSTINHIACGSYTLNGQTLSNSGTYTQTLVNSSGCDSIITLVLTINTPLSVNLGLDDTLCSNNNDIVILDAGNIGMNYLWNDNSTNQTLIINSEFMENGLYFYSVTVTDTFGLCTAVDSVEFTVDICSEVNNNNKLPLIFFPNPTNEFLRIENLRSESIEFYNSLGEKLFLVIPTTNKIELNLSKYSSGNYFLKFLGKNNVITRKILKID